MDIFDLVLSSFNVFICVSGLLLCIILLIDTELQDGSFLDVVPLCLLGIGWSIFLYASIDLFELPKFFFIMGRLCFLIGCFLWFYKNVVQLKVNNCFLNREQNLKENGGK
jgi:hypothetical protein